MNSFPGTTLILTTLGRAGVLSTGAGPSAPLTRPFTGFRSIFRYGHYTVTLAWLCSRYGIIEVHQEAKKIYSILRKREKREEAERREEWMLFFRGSEVPFCLYRLTRVDTYKLYKYIQNFKSSTENRASAGKNKKYYTGYLGWVWTFRFLYQNEEK